MILLAGGSIISRMGQVMAGLTYTRSTALSSKNTILPNPIRSDAYRFPRIYYRTSI